MRDKRTSESTAKSFKPAKYKGKPIWTIDCETDPFKRKRIPRPFIWGVYTGSDYHEFTDTEAMIEMLIEQEVICYAHNGGKFDWHFLYEYIPDFEPLTIIAGRLAKFSILNCEFRDSYNLIPAPLSAYKKDDIDYAIMEESERYKPENWEKITSYLKSDCVYLHEMVTSFIDTYGMGLTQASVAMKVWSKMSGIKKPNSGPGYYEEFAKYYYGGRVECFRLGIIEEKFSVVDIRSAYPRAMTTKHPWGQNFSIYDYIPEEFDDDDISRCFISLRGRSLGSFPFRTESGLTFPNDGEERDFHITGWEYLAARDTNTLDVVSIIECRSFDETIDFVDYVDYFFALKNEADTWLKQHHESHKDYSYWQSMRLFAKIFLNALYGKFASNPENYEEFMTIPAEYIDAAHEDGGWNFSKLITAETAVVNRPLEEEKRRYYDVSVAASITGYVRAYLWRNLCATGGTALYCDTDSIAANDVSGINIAEGLGNWELEAVCNYAAIAGKKLYAFRKEDGGWKTASKGARLLPADIIGIAEGGEFVYEPEVPTFSVKQGIKFTPRRIRMLTEA